MTDEHAGESSQQPTRETATGGASRAVLEYGWASPLDRRCSPDLRELLEQRRKLHGPVRPTMTQQAQRADRCFLMRGESVASATC